MQEISVVCRATPKVNRPPGAQTVYLTFEGLRESRTIADKLTRVQIVLPAAQSRLLWHQLAAVLPPDSQPDRQQPAAIVKSDGNSDTMQDLVDIAPENEQAGQRRNDRREPFRLGWLEFDRIDVHGRALLLAYIAPGTIRPRQRWKTVLSYGSGISFPRL